MTLKITWNWRVLILTFVLSWVLFFESKAIACTDLLHDKEVHEVAPHKDALTTYLDEEEELRLKIDQLLTEVLAKSTWIKISNSIFVIKTEIEKSKRIKRSEWLARIGNLVLEFKPKLDHFENECLSLKIDLSLLQEKKQKLIHQEHAALAEIKVLVVSLPEEIQTDFSLNVDLNRKIFQLDHLLNTETIFQSQGDILLGLNKIIGIFKNLIQILSNSSKANLDSEFIDLRSDEYKVISQIESGIFKRLR